MPTEEQFDQVADELLLNDMPVSLKTIRPGLIALTEVAGSNRELGPLLVAWKIKRNYRPKLDLKGLPERLQASFGALATAMWMEAQSDAAVKSIIDERNHEMALAARDAVLNEALASLDAAQEELAGMRERMQRLERQMGRVRAWDFWDAVMREVYELIPADGALTAEAILPDLRASTIRGAALQHDDLTVPNLREKMRVRVTHGWYFTVDDHGNFARGAYPGTMRRRAGPA